MSAAFSFCETYSAPPWCPWHIRALSQRGKKLGGGADTPALCGTLVAWDLEVHINEHHLSHACEACVEKYLQQRENEGGA